MRVREFEARVWRLDQRINMRGFAVDRQLARAAARACEEEKIALDKKISQITKGKINSATETARVKQFLNDQGVDVDNVQAATLSKLSDDDSVTGEARAIIDARQRVSKSSTSKFLTLLRAASIDGRLRGGFQYCGALRTARWAGRMFQPHNLPRPKRSWPEILEGIKALKNGNADLLTDNIHQLCADIARSVIIAAKGKKLVVADYSAIEARVLAWLVDEQWKLADYFQDKDIYISTFLRMFGLDENTDVSKDERQEGKCFELSMGYEGGVRALVQASKTYGVDLRKLGAGAWRVAPRSMKEKSKTLYEFALEDDNRRDLAEKLGEKLYRQLEVAKMLWRSVSPKTVRAWRLWDEAAKSAMRNPGEMYAACKIRFCYKNDNLMIMLPSGRMLIYYKARLHEKKGSRKSSGITYNAQYGGRTHLYGGKIAENVTQAIARDLLAIAMLKVDKFMPIVLHVHDEIVAEVKKNMKGALDKMKRLMCELPPWAIGLPLAAEGYEAKRYRKD